MSTYDSSDSMERGLARTGLKNPRVIKTIQVLSQTVTAIFLVALVWVIYQAFVNGNPLPAWAWLGTIALLAAVIGLGVALVVYRSVSTQTGPFDFELSTEARGELQNETRRLEADSATSLQAHIKMTAGVLQVTGGTTAVMEADFAYDPADWKPPAIDYAVDEAGQGSLTIEQGPTHRPAMRPGRCEWHINLSEHLPTELNVKFGAGKAELELAGLRLGRLHVESGVGELFLDLSEPLAGDLAAFVKCGIGDVVIRLPRNTGIRVQSSGGLGRLEHQGLTWDGEAYANALFGQTSANLQLVLEGGIGKITLAQPN
ncbi:MAG: hypothetical protein KC441_12425 [Anaerolineales bacterium]|nr:hypothetical protein [Anaerolineales bacterium]